MLIYMLMKKKQKIISKIKLPPGKDGKQRGRLFFKEWRVPFLVQIFKIGIKKPPGGGLYIFYLFNLSLNRIVCFLMEANANSTDVSKCLLLCANCHRELHNPDKNAWSIQVYLVGSVGWVTNILPIMSRSAFTRLS